MVTSESTVTMFTLRNPKECACSEQRNILVSASSCLLATWGMGLTCIFPLIATRQKAKSLTVTKSSFSANALRCAGVGVDQSLSRKATRSTLFSEHPMYFLNCFGKHCSCLLTTIRTDWLVFRLFLSISLIEFLRY